METQQRQSRKSPRLKRGHNSDFALPRSSIETMIKVTSGKTRAIFLMLKLGLSISQMREFNSTKLVPSQMDDSWYYDTGATYEVLTQSEYDILSRFPDGLNLTGVSIWRRVRTALRKANDNYDIYLPDPENIPFPAALRIPKEEHRAELLPRVLNALQDPSKIKIYHDSDGVEHVDLILGAQL